jgi:hemerythrin-like domain-containing protein
MSAMQELRQEHEAVKLTLRVLDRMCQKVERSGKPGDPQHVEHLLEFFTVFVDKCHHGKEEELLFPALEEIGVGREKGPIGFMLQEHERGRECVRKMKDAFTRSKTGAAHAAADFTRSARDYISLLNQHIEKENGILFPLAEKQLPEAKLAELLKGFETIELEKIGAGKHEEFHKMLDQLENFYLK